MDTIKTEFTSSRAVTAFVSVNTAWTFFESSTVVGVAVLHLGSAALPRYGTAAEHPVPAKGRRDELNEKNQNSKKGYR